MTPAEMDLTLKKLGLTPKNLVSRGQWPLNFRAKIKPCTQVNALRPMTVLPFHGFCFPWVFDWKYKFLAVVVKMDQWETISRFA